MLQPNSARTRLPARSQSRRSTRDTRALACLLMGLVALVVVFAAVLSQPSRVRAGTNGVWTSSQVAELQTGQRVCQGRELLPAGATAVRFEARGLQPSASPRLFITMRRHGRTLERTSATLGASSSVTAPLTPLAHDADDVTVCLSTGTPPGGVALGGGTTPPDVGSLSIAGRPVGASLTLTYVKPSAGSWWSAVATIAERMARGRGDLGGAWVPWAVGGLLLVSLALVVWTLMRGVVASDAPVAARRRRLPPLAWTVAAIAFANAVAWSLITPPFQVPDEQTHVAYVQQLAENKRPPVVARGNERLAPELVAAMSVTRFGYADASIDARTLRAAVWSPLQQRGLERTLHSGLSRRGNGTAGAVAPEPPAYYALEAAPYRLAAGATLLDRIALMRLLSALMAGTTALFALLFVRECLPGRPWAWWAGGLVVALSPMLGFMSGGVNPDALLFALCAALFHAFAVAFRRGLTSRRALWIGALLGASAVAKINFYGLVPGALLAVVLAARASSGGMNRRALRLVAIAVGVGLAPYLLMTALDALVWDRAFVLARTPAEQPEDHGGLGGQLSYLWQLFLPPLPGQERIVDGAPPAYSFLFKGLVGRFGWLAVSFPEWVYAVASALTTLVLALAARTAWTGRAALRRRAAELLSYAAMAGGLVLLIALVALRGFAPGLPGAFQGRYLLPLVALMSALLVAGVRGAGARWGRAVSVGIVLVCVAWSLYAQLLTILWFYT